MNNTNNPLDRARELGYTILKSVEYENLIKAEENYLNDNYAIELIKILNAKSEEYNVLKSNYNKEEHLILELEKDINKFKKEVDNNKSIQNFYVCKSEYDKLLKNINNLIKFITNEDERISIDINTNNKCSSCRGCKK